MNNNTNNQGFQAYANPPAPKVKTKSTGKTVAIVLLSVALGLVMLALTGVLLFYFLFDGDFSNIELPDPIGQLTSIGSDNDGFPSIFDKYYEDNKPALRDDPDTTEDVDEDTTEPEDTTTAEPDTDDEIDIYSVLGFWHKSGDTYERELEIHSMDEESVVFSLRYFHLNSIENVRALRHKNTAEFTHSDGFLSISGELVFEDSKIKVVIDSSDFSYMPTGTQVFGGRHSSTWEPEPETEPVDIGVEVPFNVVSPYYTEITPYLMTVYVIEGLNLRTGPDTSYDRILLLPQHTNVTVYGWNQSYDWAYVYDASSMKYGWVAAQYIASLDYFAQ